MTAPPGEWGAKWVSLSLVSKSPERSAPVCVTSCRHGAARHTDVGGLSLPGCWLLPLPPAAGRWLYVPFLQFMPIIIIIVIQHHRIKDIFVSTVVILLLKSNFININPTQLNYDSVINFGNNSSAITTIHWISLFVGRISNIQSTRLHNWRGLSFVLWTQLVCVHISACSVKVGGTTPGTRLSVYQTPAACCCHESDSGHEK